MNDAICIGLIADTHIPGARKSLWPQVYDAFASVDYIVHAGDLHVPQVIDDLASLAPTYAVRGNGDVGVDHPQLEDTWVLDLGGVKIGVVHEFPTPRRNSSKVLEARLAKVFPEPPPDVVVYGHTHHEELHRVNDVLYINPGSPTLPRNRSTRLGTIGFLRVNSGTVSGRLFQITDHGIEPIVR
ncbi:MAG: metallophosphoesterase [Gammaproteobacteria bacterium]|nr:metallophosphoesterase [Gammaproteobacteria bacterium]